MTCKTIRQNGSVSNDQQLATTPRLDSTTSQGTPRTRPRTTTRCWLQPRRQPARLLPQMQPTEVQPTNRGVPSPPASVAGADHRKAAALQPRLRHPHQHRAASADQRPMHHRPTGPAHRRCVGLLGSPATGRTQDTLTPFPYLNNPTQKGQQRTPGSPGAPGRQLLPPPRRRKTTRGLPRDPRSPRQPRQEGTSTSSPTMGAMYKENPHHAPAE